MSATGDDTILCTDGTPIKDIETYNRDLVAELKILRRNMREIVRLCDAPGFTAASRRTAIRAVARRE